MAKISYRKFEPGDEKSINDLYRKVTGIERSIEEFYWQWLSSPGGPGEIWLIEYDDGNSKALVGHHGIMPFYFSKGLRDLVAGKTENTMVLPEYRRKLLYPKYEKIFLENYKHRFDLLFSTTGPTAALRQRKALGYSASEKWVFYDWGLKSGARLAKISYSLSMKKEKPFYLKVLHSLLKLVLNVLSYLPADRIDKDLPVSVLTRQEAKEHSFFDDFWSSCRKAYGITPRRNREDLSWRFWDNPYGEYLTILIDEQSDSSAYAVVRKRSKTLYSLDDFVSKNPSSENYKRIVEIIGKWAVGNGCLVLSFATTTDNEVGIAGLNEVTFKNIREMYPFSRKLLDDKKMMRKAFPERMNCDSLDVENWYVTPFIFEGR